MSKEKMHFQKRVQILNKEASYRYELIDKYVAGIVLRGCEIKSIRLLRVNFVDSFCFFVDQELFIRNLHISAYENGSFGFYEPKSDRKLLLRGKELKKLFATLKDKGITLVPTKLFINEKGFCKIEFAVARGKKLHDKRESIKKKDEERQMRREGVFRV